MNPTFSQSVVLTREAILQRQALASKAPKPVFRRPSIRSSKPLQIIVEEEESRSTTSRSSSPMTGYDSSSSSVLAVKAKRRHHNLSACDIQIARDFVGIGDDDNLSDREDRLLLVPPSSTHLLQVPSPAPSLDSFKLTMTDDECYTFPHPPVPTPSSSSRRIQSYCTSPTLPSPSSSTGSSSSQSAGLPPTPTSSDDEFFLLPSPRFNPRRAAIQPLVIRKHTPSSSPMSEPSFLSKLKDEPEVIPQAASPFTSDYSSSESDYDADSDSEWYNNELSKLVTVPAPASTPSYKSRPESTFGLPKKINSPVTSQALPGLPTGQLDPTFPRKRFTRRSIPKYPPPPIPTGPRATRSSNVPVPASPTSPLSSHLSFSQYSTPSPIRPPPRNSVPADFIFDDDTSSAFSFTFYEDLIPDSRRSSFSHELFPESLPVVLESNESPLDDAEFEIDMEYPLMLPLSLPGTPMDLESDIANTLEELRMRDTAPVAPEEPRKPTVQIKESRPPVTPRRPRIAEPVDMPTSPPTTPPKFTIYDEERVLKSRWSSSTLGSIREEHERRGTSRIRSYFSPSPNKKRSSGKQVPPSPSPLSPVSFMGTPGKKRSSGRRESETPVTPQKGVQRRGSLTPSLSQSDTGSEISASSSSSSGLRRKPIPIELFLRN